LESLIEMTKTCSLFVLTVPLLCVVSTTLLAQSTKTNNSFLIDVNRPFVYVKFDHIGRGAPRSADEPNSRIWLRLTNNCRIPILVRANGVPDESPKDEVGLEWRVVPNPTIQGMVSFSPSGKDQPQTGQKAEIQKSGLKADEIPAGYMEEVASLVTIGPGEEVLFSMPVNHLGKRWHVEIPFEFELPKGKGLRDPAKGGEPIMVVSYSLWDLPPKALTELGEK
jgi:hypothetical protein